ncbi:MAG: flippase-like domain-containing protein [Burkholderiales bacterium]|nr:flippase-like domain-containing protein [Burkholderiales bacterium]MDQ3197068.1 flippase-like domain-containing protein [Pseudomonadota bacterium]
MRYLKLVFLTLGLLLLGLVVRDLNVDEVFAQIAEVGVIGMTFVVLFYAPVFAADAAGWQLILTSVPRDLRWLARLFNIRLAGEAFNTVTPLGSMGGEPLKALLLKSRYGIGYRESSVSLILAKTIILIALVLFLTIGFLLLLPSGRVSSAYKFIAGAGLIALTLSIAGCFVIQRLRLSSRLGSWLGRIFGARVTGRLQRLILLIHDIDERLVHFYTEHRARSVAAFLLALLSWIGGVIEVYVVMWLLGYPVTFNEAWIIEALVQLVRAGTFFIPASIGAQEGTLVMVCSAMTGNPAVGLALSVIRRVREVVWIAAGIAVWWIYSLNRTNPKESEREVV